MAKITAAREFSLETVPDFPEELFPWVEQQNSVGRQVISAFQRGITIGENTTSIIKEIDLVHAQSVTVANPLSVPIQGIFAIGCVGLTVGSDGKPTGGVYDLALPKIEAKPSTKGDGSWVVQANYDIGPNETSLGIGETIGPINRVRSAATNLTSNVTANVCTTTSMTLTPGDWIVRSAIGFIPAASTNVTQMAGAISLTSATLPGSDLDVVPQASEVRLTWNQAATVPVSAQEFTLPNYKITVAGGATATIFLVGRAIFTASTMAVFGSVEAERSTPYLIGRTGRVKLWFFGG